MECIICSDEVYKNQEVRDLFNREAELYLPVAGAYAKGRFHRLVQDAGKMVPSSVMNDFSGIMNQIGAWGISLWAENKKLPDEMRKLGGWFRNGVDRALPIMNEGPVFRDLNLETLLENSSFSSGLRLNEDPAGFYGNADLFEDYDPDFHRIADYGIFNKIKKLIGKSRWDEIKKPGTRAIYVSKNIPIKISLQEAIENIRDTNKRKTLEMLNVTVLSKRDWSDDIDKMRHKKDNKKALSVYYILNNHPTFSNPKTLVKHESYQGQVEELNNYSLETYHELVDRGVPRKEAVQVINRTLEVITLEEIDGISGLNEVQLRTCSKARPGMQEWAKDLVGILKKHVFNDFGEELLQRLPRGNVLRYCPEYDPCNHCGNVIQLHPKKR
jgi:hypothetical protein